MLAEDSDSINSNKNNGGDGTTSTTAINNFCSEYAHLSLCQLRQQLIQLNPLLQSAIGEIDFLAGGNTAAGTGSPRSMAMEAENDDEIQGQEQQQQFHPEDLFLQKRRSSLADAPLMIRLAKSIGPINGRIRGGAGPLGPAGGSAAGMFLAGGPLRRQPLPVPQLRPSNYRLVRMPYNVAAANRAASSITANNGAKGTTLTMSPRIVNQLLRQLWA